MDINYKGLKICMIADGHGLYDDRLYWKEALSFQRNGFEIVIIITGNNEREGHTEHGIQFYEVKVERYFKNKFLHFIFQSFYHKTNRKILKIAKTVHADIYNFHDYQQHVILKSIKKFKHHPKVVYDARVPLFHQLYSLSQDTGVRRFLVKLYAYYKQYYEYHVSKYYDAVLAVDDGIYNGFLKNSKCKYIDTIYNYTTLNDERKDIPLNQRKYDAIHCGGITKARGFYELLKIGKLLAKYDKKLLLLGRIFEEQLIEDFIFFVKENKLENHLIWIQPVGFNKVSDYYNDSKIGLNILLPNPAHEMIIQIKLFEFMNFGLPIITSNFGEMKSYVEKEDVGMTVNPFDENEIIDKIILILNDQNLYQKYCDNGKKAVDSRYNWALMEEKLVGIYHNL